MNFGISDVQKKSENFYAIVCPGTIRANSDFSVIASVHKSEVPVKINVSINGGEFSIGRIVEIQPYSCETITFSIPSIKEGKYLIKAEGLSGIEFKNEKSLEYSKVSSFVLMQTDKATYKPGDLVRFRVLILDKETRPAKINEAISISIMDSQQNIIKLIKTAEFTKGVYSGEMQLSQFPNLGKWKITVTYGKNSDSSNFEVDKYVLPKFDVTIDAPRDIYKDDEMIKAIVRAKYTYGKPVKGKATIKLNDKCQFWQGNINKNTILTQNASIDGKFSFEIYLANELYSENNCAFKNYEIEATVEEALTGLKMDATANFTIHTEKFKIEGVNIPRNFIGETPLEVTVVVKNYDGSPVQDTINSVTITIEPERRLNRCMFYLNKEEADKAAEEKRDMEEKLRKLIFHEKLDKNGMATVNFIVPKDLDSYSIRTKYLDQEQFLGSIHRLRSVADSNLQLYTQIKKARLDREVAIQVTSKTPLKYFFYQIIAKGNIVEAGKIDVPEDRTNCVFKFRPIFAMVPSCYVFVYYIKDGDVVFTEKYIEIEPQLNGFIRINAPAQAKAGDEVELKVVTKPDSYIGLLGVDQSVLLLKSGNDLKNGDVINGLNNFKTTTLFESWFHDTKIPGRDCGVVMMTNGKYEKETKESVHQMFGGPAPCFGGMAKRSAATACAFGSSSAKAMYSQPIFGAQQQLQAVPQLEIRKRKDFPETWLWWSSNENHNGEVVVRSKVPDTITSWVLTGFSVSPESGLGLTSQPHKLQVFQPFFVSTNLPYSVKRGEVIAIPVLVFNYMEDNIKANVTLDNAHDEFVFVTLPGETESKNNTKTQQTKPVEIESGSGVSKSFLIRPKKAGQITLKISAVSPVAGDILHQVLRVDPEGVTEFVNKAVFLDLRDQKEQSREISIEVPGNAVPDSTHVEVSIVGDLLGPTMKNLDKLVRMPCGCGEQNMVNFVPNILILKYLTKINKAALDIADKAKKCLEIGYQRELTYKHNDGSYSAFGKRDKSGSTWLTAYVARSFSEAKEVTNIDDKAIKDALDFLVFCQSGDGNFAEIGRIIDQHHAGKSTKGLALTAFTLLAFLELKQEEILNYKHVISKGLEYLAKNIDDETDNYALAISTYVLQKAKHDKKEIFLEKFKARKQKDDGHVWWADESQLPNIEITAYGLLALLESGAGEETLPVLRWLVGQRNSNGGFKTTQDTVVGLRAMVKLCEELNAGFSNVSFTFSDDKGGKGEIFVNEDNAIVFQTHVLNPEARLVKITGRGIGSSQVQVSYRYNIANKSNSPRFIIKPEVKETANTDQIQLSVCASFIPQGDEKTSNMAVMEVSLPSGYIADEDNLNEIEKVKRVRKVETKNGESVIVIYFDDLDSTDVCSLIKGLRAHRVAEQKPSAIVLYDYYDNNRQARAFYEIPNTSLNGVLDGA